MFAIGQVWYLGLPIGLHIAVAQPRLTWDNPGRHKREVIQTRNTVTVRQVERRDGRVGAIILVREVCPNTLVHRVERLRTVHEGEGGNIGQVDLGEFRVVCHQRVGIGFSGDRLDQCIGSRIDIAAPVAVPVVLRDQRIQS